MNQEPANLLLRTEVRPTDIEHVQRVTAATGFFSAEEVAIAVEVIQEALSRGPAAGYQFIFAEDQQAVMGYACFGPIPCTRSSFDLYWIAVDPRLQGQGLGQRLLRESEQMIAQAGGTQIYLDTSGRSQYDPTRRFYQRCGYQQAAVLADFYAPNDAKVIFHKRLG